MLLVLHASSFTSLHVRIHRLHGQDYAKIKKAEQWDHAYVTFYNEEQRKHARDVLDGYEYRYVACTSTRLI